MQKQPETPPRRRAWRGAALAFLTALLALPPGAAGAVICICHDGHVAFESLCRPETCCSEAETAHDAVVSPVCDNPEGHSCADIPIPAQGQLFDAARTKTPVNMLAGMRTAVFAALSGSVTALSTLLPAEASPEADLSLAPCVRTVVLRC